MSADSGKPDAGEWAKKAIVVNGDDLEIHFPKGFELIVDGPQTELDVDNCAEYWQSNLADLLADFQRETLLWAASQFSDYLTKKTLERLAESCGRGMRAEEKP